MTWELILDGYSESSYSATPRFAASRPPWFRKALWMEVGKDPELLKQFKNQNKVLVTKGKSSFVPESERVGERERFELHHIKRVTDGGAVYDIDNLRVVTPKHHIEIHRGNK
ncbi:HNH endonuclease signature motif containing protein [Escherichia coli]|uniref:HNH endonuclease signature motif containing protein n=1 Tax=Escherichia coli TaxID=562 RepID=UPI002DDCB746|nr:HNH endonuclease signature motif containing protein [Escherichia coli]